MFGQILQGSPQYSGDFAASWRVSYHSVDYTYENDLFIHDVIETGPFQRGSRKPIDHAKGRAQWPKLGLGSHIYLSNSAAHEEPYAWKIESGAIHFRPVNEGADHVVARTVTYVGNLYKTISAPQLANLRTGRF